MDTTDPVGRVVATNIKRLRQRRRLTLKETSEELASVLGTSPLSEGGLSRWENSDPPRRFSMTELFAICRVFDVRLAELFRPDMDVPIPTINGEPYFAVWGVCFDSTDRMKSRWQQLEFVQQQQITGLTAEQLEEAKQLWLERQSKGEE
jgi:transcriptional regulator with XRE-family HTH domain